MTYNILHVIPPLNIGGVEKASSLVKSLTNYKFSYQKLCYAHPFDTNHVFDSTDVWAPDSLGINNPFAFIELVIKLFSSRPNCIICSLWRSLLPSILIKFLFPSTKLVLFCHSTVSVHIVDKILTDFFYDYC